MSKWPSSKNLQTINAGEGVEKREPSCMTDRSINWYSHYREQFGGSLKILKIYHVTQQFHYWTYTQRKTIIQKDSSVQLLNCVQLFASPWSTACQASLSITNSQNLLKLMFFESVMPSNHLIVCCPLFLPPSIFPSIRDFSNESLLHIRGPKYWEFQHQHQSFQWIFRTDFL